MDEVRVYRDIEALAQESAGLILEEIRRTLHRHGRATVILAGGSTPRGCYSDLAGRLSTGRVPLDRLTWLIGDERWVPPDQPGSNEHMARQTLFAPLGVPAQRILSWQAGTGDPGYRAARFEEKVRRHLAGQLEETGGPDRRPPAAPRIGPLLVLLGMGADGHTASLLPDAMAVLPGSRRVPMSPDLPGLAAAVFQPETGVWRLTLTPRFLRQACRIFFLVSGAEKKETLREVLNGDPRYPASWLNLPQTTFLVTRDAVEAIRL